jgi:photosystem II stability/assembly factor-like uncharacterized protein
MFSRWRKRSSVSRIAAYVSLVLILSAIQIATNAPSATHAHADTVWAPQASPTTNNLNFVACPSTTACFAVGDSGTILATTTGTAWIPQSSGVTWTLHGVSCPSVSVCYAAGENGTILKTTNSGDTWTTLTTGTTSILYAISCPSLTTCFAVGRGGKAYATINGGGAWASQPIGTLSWQSAVSCVAVTTCYSVGDSGTVQTTTNGGTTWASQSLGTTQSFVGLSCPLVSTCVATGTAGVVRATTTGWNTWTSQQSGTSSGLYAVSCSLVSTCAAVGFAGAAIATTDGGNTWNSDVSGTLNNLYGVACPSAVQCWAVGTVGTILVGRATPDVPPSPGPTVPPVPTISPLPTPSPLPTLPGGYPSDTCDTGTNVLTGFIDGTFVKAKTSAGGSNTTLLCVAGQASGAHVGGKLTLNANAPGLSIASVDLDNASVSACSTNANNTHVNGGQIAGQPWFVDVTPSPAGSTDSAWVCVRMTNSVGFRLRFAPGVPIGLPSFNADSTSLHVPDYVQDPPAAATQPSATCQVAGGTRLANLTIGTTPIQLYTWLESATKAHLCVRGGAAGGKGAELTLTTDGVDPGLSTTNSTGPCPFPLFTSDSPSFGSYTSNPSLSPPASACIAVGTTAIGVTADAPSVGSVVAVEQDTA